MSGAELARRSGISPAYVTLIEKGAKVPAADVAERIARALDDDPEVYRAWSLAEKLPDANAALADLWRAQVMAHDRVTQSTLSSGADFDVTPLANTPPEPAQAGRRVMSVRTRGPEATIHAELLDSRTTSVPAMAEAAAEMATRVASPTGLVELKVLRPGEDPGDGAAVPDSLVIDTMLVDPRLLGIAPPRRPFAFQADDVVARRVPAEVRAGDWVIVSRDVDAIVPGVTYAVRLHGGIVLSHVIVRGNRLVLPPAPGESDLEELSAARGDAVRRFVAGSVAAVVRASR